jgi:hypothetical protein
MFEQLKQSPYLLGLKARYPLVSWVVVIVAIIMLWRGVWGLLDLYLFPGSPTLSHIVSLLLGILVLYLDDFKIENLKR